MKKIIDQVTDYHNFTNLYTPKSQRRKWNIGDIYDNKAKCKKCGDIVRSKNRHDYAECKCGSIAVDGGSWYLRRCGNIEDIEDLSEMYSDYIGEE